MKLCITSDIHHGISEYYKKKYNFTCLNSADMTVICGDIGEHALVTEKWLDKNVENFVAVEGNHFGYEKCSNPTLDYKEGGIDYLRKKYNRGAKRFLENDYFELENVVFAGCTLYTDFNLHRTPETSMRIAQRNMNDYNHVKCLCGNEVTRLYPQKTVEWHNASMKFLTSVCEKYEGTDKKIVVITHHAPSEKSIDPIYAWDDVTPAYCSDLEWMMEKYDNLKLWCHGHMHSNFDYTVHGTRVVCNPFGYCNQLNRPLDQLGLIIDTDTL